MKGSTLDGPLGLFLLSMKCFCVLGGNSPTQGRQNVLFMPHTPSTVNIYFLYLSLYQEIQHFPVEGNFSSKKALKKDNIKKA